MSLSSGNLEDWTQWRRSVDGQLLNHAESIATLKAYQQVSRENEAARHSKTPQIAFGLFSAAVSLILLILQLLAARLGGP